MVWLVGPGLSSGGSAKQSFCRPAKGIAQLRLRKLRLRPPSSSAPASHTRWSQLSLPPLACAGGNAAHYRSSASVVLSCVAISHLPRFLIRCDSRMLLIPNVFGCTSDPDGSQYIINGIKSLSVGRGVDGTMVLRHDIPSLVDDGTMVLRHDIPSLVDDGTMVLRHDIPSMVDDRDGTTA